MANQATLRDRQLVSEMRVSEFVGKDGKDGSHLGNFSRLYYQINCAQSNLMAMNRDGGSSFAPQIEYMSVEQKWAHILEQTRRMKWISAVKLLVRMSHEVKNDELQRREWAKAQAIKREKLREAHVQEWIARDRKLATQSRPATRLRGHRKYV